MAGDWARLEEIASWAARRHHSPVLGYESKWEAAWCGAAEAIAAGDPKPGMAALNAITAEDRQQRRAHGIPYTSKGSTGSRYAAYWKGPPLTDPFEVLDDRLAVAAVWQALPEDHARILAAHVQARGDTHRAARIAGLPYGRYRDKLMAARQCARALWHAPELPPARHYRTVRRSRDLRSPVRQPANEDSTERD